MNCLQSRSTHLLELQAERALATIEGIAANSVYMADLDGEIEATARAYAARLTVSEYRCCRPRLLPWWRGILQRPGR